VIGDGSVDLFFLQGLLSHLDMQWCDPIFSAFLYRIASRCRLIVMDQRGVGLSDGSGTIPTIDERVADMAAVADAVGTDRMFVAGHCHGGPPAIVHTASHPERVAGLILMSTFAVGTADHDNRRLHRGGRPLRRRALGIAADCGFAIRCGVHAGGYTPAGEDAIGLTVIIASRLMAAARDGSILVSNAVSTAVMGADFQFLRARELTLKGVPGSVAAAEFVTDGDVQNATSRWRPDPAVHGPTPTWLDRLAVLGARHFPGASHVLSTAKHGATAWGAHGGAVRRRGLAGPVPRRP
jgi:pimeloyl-ACP methyl ester carboxylesterase